ncbi:hypothetical protein Forpe1208_v013664 [Fusarium oxysporum f. sp. rapae]|uniref:Uncharacterized protein n=1 Tax=Fusarium oxysporum f. sp. rapae TaxID=485398 RepID=A0A8J5NHF1_FUSOX|nr:hypothetical protein Forpe1208_v013664 [Fusarium oxysporum f. sp. rapae]
MSHQYGNKPITTDSSTELVRPDAPQFQETNDEPKNPIAAEPERPESRDWTEIVAEQAGRLAVARRLSVKRWAEPLYSHLPNSTIDWKLDGSYTVCRVVGLSCYGRDYNKTHDMKVHLSSKPHREYDASLAEASTTPSVAPVPRRTTGDENSPVPPKKPRLRHTIENTTGSDLCLPLIVNDEALELPRALKYPFWMEIPDSTENSDNEILGTDSEEALEQQERLYSSWEEISDSNEDSESEALV